MLSRGKSLILGPLLAGGAFALARAGGLPLPASWTAAVAALCATWWILEPIPIPATSLIPFAMFPVLGVLDEKQTAAAYGHPLILLLLGGFILSTALERNQAHRRLAFLMLRLAGTRSRRRIVLGFMLATAAVSMWISNTATALMMLPVAIAVLEQDGSGELDVPLLLGIAYAASIGGLGTPIGTPPNVIFMGVYREVTGNTPTFLDWMKIGVPASALLLPVAWLILTRKLKQGGTFTLSGPGPWRPRERRVLVVFAITAIAWMTRTAPAGGWGRLLGMPEVGDGTVALLASVVLFLIPDGEGGALLDWPSAVRIPWGILILFGGGIAVAAAFEATGLSRSIGQAMAGAAGWSKLGVTFLLCLGAAFLTEVTSNTATATILMPVLAAAGIAAGGDPAWLMVPAALSVSCAFMLPVATPPNAVVFGTDRVTVRQMARTGVGINLVGAVVLSVLCVLLVPHVFGGIGGK